MKSRIRLFLWLSALLAGLAFLGMANWLPAFIAAGAPSFQELDEPGRVFGYDKIRFGLFILGSLLLLLSTLLFLLGKKLKNSTYTILFLLIMILCIFAGAAATTL